MTTAFELQGRGGPSGRVRSIGIGMLGYAFMGKAHANAYRSLAYMTWPPPFRPELVAIAGRNEPAAAEAALRYGFTSHVTDWRELVADQRISVFDNCAPNDLHAEPTVAAAEAGKHVICEKPLARTAAESHEMWQRVARTGVKHMCAFNYRFVPAVRLARKMIEAGELGEIRHFRGAYLQDWGDTDAAVWRFDRALAGSGALGDLGAHVIDLARYLVGEIEAVAAVAATFRPGRDVDDAIHSTVRFANGAVGTVEATRFATGHKNALVFEINGSRGSLAFDLERLNELRVCGSDGRGFKDVLVTDPTDPFWSFWWPPGHTIGWEHTFIHEIHHLLTAIRDDTPIGPHAATFEDGYRAAEVCDAIVRSVEQRAQVAIQYR